MTAVVFLIYFVSIRNIFAAFLVALIHRLGLEKKKTMNLFVLSVFASAIYKTHCF